MDSRSRSVFAGALIAVAVASASCDAPAKPTAAPLPLQRETAGMQYYYADGDTINVDSQEIYNAWAIERMGVRPPQRIEYYKYRSKTDMGDHTGQYSSNAYAEPELFRIHTIFSTDNHEVVHVLSALIGRPSDFFNEGFAVSFQTHPAQGDFTVLFNGVQVHDAVRSYLTTGVLPRPLASYVTSDAFRSISDSTMSYRMAGSFVLYLTERFGLSSMMAFLRGGGRSESLAAIQGRMQSVFGLSVEEAESGWIAMLQAR